MLVSLVLKTCNLELYDINILGNMAYRYEYLSMKNIYLAT